MPGPIYTVSVSSAVSTGVVKDFFEVDASTTERLILRELVIGQYASSQGSSGFLQVLIYRGSTAACSGGTTGTAIKRDARDRGSTALITFSASSPSTGGDIVAALTWNLREPLVYRPDANERPIAGLGERLNVRVGAPHETITWTGHLKFEEAGTPASG